MRVHYDFAFAGSLGPAALAISDFDGVHRAHRRLVEAAVAVAGQVGASPVALVIWPGPEDVAVADAAARLLTTLDERLALLGRLGTIEHALVLSTSPERAGMTAEAFLERVGVWCEPRELIGFARPDAADAPVWSIGRLSAVAVARGIAVRQVAAGDGAPEEAPDAAQGTVRGAVEAGDMEMAARLLEHHFSLGGQVVEGDKRGRLLGFPTANLRPDPRKVLPANGVYAVRVRLPGEAEAAHPAVANVGVRPTFGAENPRVVEVHVLDAALDLYGLPIAVEFVGRLRAERRFDGVDALKAQIAQDIGRARALLSEEAALAEHVADRLEPAR